MPWSNILMRFVRRLCAATCALLLLVSVTDVRAAGTHRLSAAFPAAIQTYRTPIYWASRRTGVPANVLGAVMLTESGGNPNASSGAAYGLMQVTAATAGAYHCGSLYDPGPNINCGARVLASFIRYEGGSLFLGLAAYNAGFQDTGLGYSYARIVLSRVPRA